MKKTYESPVAEKLEFDYLLTTEESDPCHIVALSQDATVCNIKEQTPDA